MSPAQTLRDLKDLLQQEPSAAAISSVEEILASTEFRSVLADYIADPTANSDRRSEILSLLNGLRRACRNRREQLDGLKDGILAYKNGGGLALLGTGVGALLTGILAGIVPIGAGVYLMVTGELGRRQLTRELSAIADVVEVLEELKVEINAR